MIVHTVFIPVIYSLLVLNIIPPIFFIIIADLNFLEKIILKDFLGKILSTLEKYT